MVKQLIWTQGTLFWSVAIQLDKQDSGRNMHHIAVSSSWRHIDSKFFEMGFSPIDVHCSVKLLLMYTKTRAGRGRRGKGVVLLLELQVAVSTVFSTAITFQLISIIFICKKRVGQSKVIYFIVGFMQLTCNLKNNYFPLLEIILSTPHSKDAQKYIGLWDSIYFQKWHSK